mgnify:CR=1 FL=1
MLGALVSQHLDGVGAKEVAEALRRYLGSVGIDPKTPGPWKLATYLDDADAYEERLAEALIARRSEEYRSECARWAAGDEPPAFLGEVESMGPRDRRMRGRGISAGVARGPARVAHTLADAQKLRPGEILVSRATDPGWTPLFRTAGGLVLEQGGMLSHGAVVAREYGLPAVVNVVDACRHIATGQSVTVDGGRGVVVLS